jgi:hypothetical protein
MKTANFNSPVILSVFDAKMHIISRTLVEYEEVELAVDSIRILCEKNQWTYKSEVPPTFGVFLTTLLNTQQKCAQKE